MVKKVNLNSNIKFKLNDLGKEIYYHRFDDINNRLISNGAKPLGQYFPKVDEKGFATFQLWDFINIYGEHIGIGKKEFWDGDFNIYIDDEDIDDV